MTPATFAKNNTEDGHQMAIFAWAVVAANNGFNVADDWAAEMGLDAAKTSHTNDQPIPELSRMFAIPNGGNRDARTGAKLKATGVKPGVPDIMWPYPCGRYAGLFIELKKPKLLGQKKGRASSEQSEWGKYLSEHYYCSVICYGWQEAVETIKQYYKRQI